MKKKEDAGRVGQAEVGVRMCRLTSESWKMRMWKKKKEKKYIYTHTHIFRKMKTPLTVSANGRVKGQGLKYGMERSNRTNDAAMLYLIMPPCPGSTWWTIDMPPC